VFRKNVLEYITQIGVKVGANVLDSLTLTIYKQEV